MKRMHGLLIPCPHAPPPQTDAFEGLEWDNPERPECTNLLNIYQSVTGKGREVSR